jgi:hypothetical protein
MLPSATVHRSAIPLLTIPNQSTDNRGSELAELLIVVSLVHRRLDAATIRL